MFSILHVSDLHRSRNEPLDNNALVAALLADRDRYMGETPIVPSPGAIVVSGDLIQGAPIGLANWQNALRDQYRVAGDFLDHLARRFLDGDRSKVVIIPGNHDVCWNTSLASMERVPEAEYPSDIRSVLLEPNSNFRWSWRERALYRICNADVYSQRMDAYWNFVKDFYADVPLLMPIDGRRGYQFFELHERRIIVAAFDSINSNDCFGYSGGISQGTVARCNLDLRDIPHSYSLRIAVWHHSIQGPPLREDYMDLEQVHEMIGLRFQLGMHGHQHVSTATTHYVHLNESQAMAVVGAGSLCAGSRELPRGVNRQYNVVVVEDDLRHARVHAREMVAGEQFSRKNNGAFSQGFVELDWQAGTDIMGRVIDVREENNRRAVSQAEDALHAGDARKATALLETIELFPNSHARRIAIQAALKLEDWMQLAGIIAQPNSIEEEVLLVSAWIRAGDLGRAGAALASCQNINATMRSELQGQIETRKMMRGK